MFVIGLLAIVVLFLVILLRKVADFKKSYDVETLLLDAFEEKKYDE